MIEAKLTKNIIKVENRETLTRGQVNTVAVHFSFSHEWDNLLRIAVFKAGNITRNVTLDETNTCFVPPEVTTHVGESVHVGVHGTKSDGVVVLPSTNACLGIVREGANPGNNCDARTPDLWEQLAGKIALLIEGTYTKEETDAAINAGDEALANQLGNLLDEMESFIEEQYYRKSETDALLKNKADKTTTEATLAKLSFDMLSKASFENIMALDAKIGDIDSALDELHNYAQALIGGEA